MEVCGGMWEFVVKYVGNGNLMDKDVVNLGLTRFSLVLDDPDHDETLEDKDTLDKETDR